MDNKISTYSPAFSIVSWIALVGGIVTYLLGLWNAVDLPLYFQTPVIT